MNAGRNAAQKSAQRNGTVSPARKIDADSATAAHAAPQKSVRDAWRALNGVTFDPPLGAGYQTPRALR
jgi:hypothetical protein